MQFAQHARNLLSHSSSQLFNSNNWSINQIQINISIQIIVQYNNHDLVFSITTSDTFRSTRIFCHCHYKYMLAETSIKHK
jgi:hypothetical protein